MKYFSRIILSLAIFCSARTQAQTAYTIQDLGTLGGPQVTVAGLNNHGDIVANIFDNSSRYTTALYSNGVLQNITAKSGIAVGNINDNGLIATSSGTGASVQAALYNTHTETSQIIGPSTPATSVAEAVNQNGNAAGLVTLPNNSGEYAALFRNGQTVAISPVANTGAIPYIATSINNQDQVVGRASTPTGDNHPFLYSGGVSYDLGTLPGGHTAGATGINDRGTVIGYSEYDSAGGQSHPFVYQNGKMQDLGTFGGPSGGASGINNAGVVVGTVGKQTTPNGLIQQVPFVYSDGVMRNLFDLIPNDGSWSVGFADAINDNGQIAGEAFHNGGLHIFLATPVATPEPGAWACFGVGAVVLGGLLRRRVRVA